MSYDTDRERRYYRWCREMDLTPTNIGYGEWRARGEPAPADPYRGTVLDRLVRKQMGLFEEAV